MEAATEEPHSKRRKIANISRRASSLIAENSDTQGGPNDAVEDDKSQDGDVSGYEEDQKEDERIVLSSGRVWLE